MGTGSFPGIKCGRGVLLTTHPLLVPWSRKSTAIPLVPLWTVPPVQSLSACTRVTFTFTLQWFFFSPCGAAAQRKAMASTFLRFLDRTQRRITVGRTPLDE